MTRLWARRQFSGGLTDQRPPVVLERGRKTLMTVRGDYYVRDKSGDQLYSVWSEEPVLFEGEWVPARPTRGTQVYLPCSHSYSS